MVKEKGKNLLNELKLSSPNDYRSFLRMDDYTYEELLNLVGPKTQKRDIQMYDAISMNQSPLQVIAFLI